MNHSTIVIILIYTLILVGIVSMVFAEHHYFEPQWFWQGSPILCLVDIPKGDLYSTLSASSLWKRTLKDYNGGTGFGYVLKVTHSGDMSLCNGYLYQSDNFVPNRGTGITPIGLTSCNGVCTLTVDRNYNEGKEYYNTVVHEVGHFLGLGHRLPYSTNGIISIFLSDDVMMPIAKPMVHITKDSLDALIRFNLDQRFINYTLPHNNEWLIK